MKYFQVGLILFTLMSCSKDDDNTSKNTIESLVFGSYNGFCIGDCFDVYRITNDKLEKDDIANFLTNDYEFKSSFEYSNDIFEKYKSFLDKIPNELINGTGKTYGCPDCADQGGFYIVIKTSAEEGFKKYTIDTYDTKDQNKEIITFKTKVLTITKELEAH